MDDLQKAVEWSRAYRQPPDPPLVLPDWLETSDVTYIRGRVGAVARRGETTMTTEDTRGQEGTP